MTGGGSEEDGDIKPIKTQSFWATVLTVETMDLIFSIDNVVAAVSLSEKIWVVLLGVGIGIITMRFAAGVFSYAVTREPILKQAAYVLVLNIGVELILDQVWHIEISDLARLEYPWRHSVAGIPCSKFLPVPFCAGMAGTGIGIINNCGLGAAPRLFRAVVTLFTPTEPTVAS
jgi:predicted tellurium resistance membrane protein TerC